MQDLLTKQLLLFGLSEYRFACDMSIQTTLRVTKELFLESIPTLDVTGSGLGNLIINALKHEPKCTRVIDQS